MKSQGLPMSFIVITIMVVLVLVVVGLFFFRSFQTKSIDVQTAVNNCDSACLLENNYAKNIKKSEFSHQNSPYCKLTQRVPGYPNNVGCEQLSKCTVTFSDGSSCTIACSDSTASCS